MSNKKSRVKAKIKQKQKIQKKAKNSVKRQNSQQIAQKTSPFLVAVAQINSNAGDINENARKIIATIDKAKQNNAQLVIFPELTVTGWPVEDLLLRPDFIDKNMQKFIEIVNATKGISCIFGFVNKANKSVYNAVAYVKDQKIMGIGNKIHPTNLFTSEQISDIFTDGTKRIGIVIANDTEEDNTIQQLIAKGIDMLVIISTSQYSLNKDPEQYILPLAKKYTIPVIYCNSVGSQSGIIYSGGSFVTDKNGTVIVRAKKFGEEIVLADISKSGTLFTPQKNQIEEVYSALTLGIRDYFAKTGHQKALVAISGGLDSSVTAALAVHSLGKENVMGLFLPSKITSKESVQDAKRICTALGIEWKTISIDSYVTPFAKAAGLKYEKKNISFIEQNIQARVRAHLLMIYANKNNLLLLSSLNKTDIATGYFTMYGESVGAFLPLGDLWKSDVMKIAQYINKQKRIIAESILKKQPSAELRPNQKDSDDLPQYEILDKILELYVVQKKDIYEITKMGFDSDMVHKIAYLVMKNEFKRRTLPFSIAITSCSFNSMKLPVVSGWKG
ncbi:MAG: NAD(+) synthase [Candidatus Woesearchaeota archaeon]|jgi:NAD+ synthase (glutamine-hydrolysing)